MPRLSKPHDVWLNRLGVAAQILAGLWLVIIVASLPLQTMTLLEFLGLGLLPAVVFFVLGRIIRRRRSKDLSQPLPRSE